MEDPAATVSGPIDPVVTLTSLTPSQMSPVESYWQGPRSPDVAGGVGRGGGHIPQYLYTVTITASEPVWPSGKALAWAGKQKDLGSIPLRLYFLFKRVVVCGHCLVTLTLTIIIIFLWPINETLNLTALIAAHLNAEVILVLTVL